MLSRKAQDQAPRRQAQAACAHRFPSLAARHRANQRVASPAASTRVWLRTEDVSNVEVRQRRACQLRAQRDRAPPQQPV